MGSCKQTNIPTVNDDAIECHELTPTNCVVLSEAVPCLQAGKGSTLTNAFKRICSVLNSIISSISNMSFLSLVDTPSNYTGAAGQQVAVNANGTGLVFRDCECLQTAEVELSAEQILNLGTNPVQFLPSPGASRYYDVVQRVIEYTFVSSAYSGANQNAMVDSDGRSYVGVIGTGTSSVYTSPGVGSSIQTNSPLTLQMSQGVNWTGGNGTLKIKILYRVMTIG
jgi:hypothetical protein